jgi:hypothetical protein
MSWNIENDGDDVEKKNAHFIRKRLKSYVLFWENFVGNKNLLPAPIPSIPPIIDEKRVAIAEINYSILRDILILQGQVKHPFGSNAIEEFDREYFLSVSAYYNILELIQQAYSILEIPFNYTIFESGFRNYRDCFVHNRRPVIRSNKGVIEVVSEFSKFENAPKFEQLTWKWYREQHIQYLPFPNYANLIIENALTSCNNLLKKEFDFMKENVLDKGLTIEPPEIVGVEFTQPNISGSVDIRTN